MSEKKYIPCGGCGAETPLERCIGCFHPFETESPAEQPVREVTEGLIETQAEYIKLLGDELNEVVGLVATRDYWRSTRVEQGKQLRQKIDELYNLKEQKEK